MNVSPSFSFVQLAVLANIWRRNGSCMRAMFTRGFLIKVGDYLIRTFPYQNATRRISVKPQTIVRKNQFNKPIKPIKAKVEKEKVIKYEIKI